MGLAIACFIIRDWTTGLSFIGAFILILKNIYFFLDFTGHRHVVSPILGYLIAFGSLAALGVALTFKVISTINVSKELDTLNFSISAIDLQSKDLYGKLSYPQGRDNLPLTEVQDKAKEIIEATNASLTSIEEE